MGDQKLPADGPIGRSRGHRLTALLLAPMGARSKTTSTQQPSNMMTKNESAKNSGHYLEFSSAWDGGVDGSMRRWLALFRRRTPSQALRPLRSELIPTSGHSLKITPK